MSEEENAEVEVVRTSRDDEALRQRLQDWLSTQLPSGASPQVSEISAPSASGMSS
ncbi:MAG: phosphotransferase family protein, partial [Deltaproteobacteria bacterium]|nr:phosphotransferase family protein [Deltaproteobacteria bacterium]